MSGKLINKWNSMTELLDHNPTYRKGAIYHHIKGKSTNAYGHKWACNPPIINHKNNTNEKFKSIGHYKKYDFSHYGISKKGQIINYKRNTIKTILINKDNYYCVGLNCDINKKEISCRVHKLVAHYISNDNPKIKTQVNHIDKNRSNNYYKNLEWVTPQDNVIHSHGKMVKMIDEETNKVIKIFKCVKDAGRYFDKKSAAHIGRVCNGQLKRCFGYKWEWVKDGEIIDKPVITIPLEKYQVDC
ncbi:mg457 protein [Tupanvirus deep ocean]|uniref:Mg457 protein n=2 Tax=Tupanvirus TaxID=2094720 RepID=A0AC62A6W2_9VIRU|nr:mg457 protein [Tupanvirus deep ocean]QKU33529.1 mg457 protein [Tupanvirus deep ocean]